MMSQQPNNRTTRLKARHKSVLVSLPKNKALFEDCLKIAQCLTNPSYQTVVPAARLNPHQTSAIAALYLTDQKGSQQWFTFPSGLEISPEITCFALTQLSQTQISSTEREDQALQFWLTIPLSMPIEGLTGILLLADATPYQLNDTQLQALKAIARQIEGQLQHLLGIEPPALAKSNPYPMMICNAEGQIIYYNAATQTLWQQLGGTDFEGLLPPQHLQIIKAALKSGQYHDRVEVTWEDTATIPSQHRIFHWCYQPIPNQKLVYLYGFEITAYKQIEALLRHEALHDELTGLPNRTFFLDRLQQAVLILSPPLPLEGEPKSSKQAQNSSLFFALLFLDIDRFKLINDSLGHWMGDQLLVLIAQRLKTVLRPGDTIARLGGDEFGLLLEGLQDHSEAIAVAQEIHQCLATPFHLYSAFLDPASPDSEATFHEVFTNASIGITFSDAHGDRPEQFLRNADIALHRAKSKGRARYEVFNSTMHERAVALLQLENDLRRAVERSEFVVYYQPIVSLDIGRITGFEALVRWQHRDRGLVSPLEFIPLAEETGLIVPIGLWVLRQSCLQLRTWQTQFPSYPPLTISVNLSGKQLAHPHFVEQVDQILQETQLEPGSLKLEITESVLMENAEAAAALLAQLRAQQIHLCVDDFGTGYSSLSYLQRFPINMLKIDKSFVSKMIVSEENLEIVKAIITLASNLGMYVTAEGVSSEAQLVKLWALNCDYGQGFLFSKPVDSETATRLAQDSPQW